MPAALSPGARRFDVRVTEPRQQIEPSALLPGVLMDSHYTSYLVRARQLQPGDGAAAAAAAAAAGAAAAAPAAGGAGAVFEVRRRFSDVVALAKVLLQLHPGCILPARPEKDALAGRRGAPAFVERRRAESEDYLRRLCLHPVAGASDALRVFLTTPGAVCLRTHPAWRAIKPRRPTRAEAAGRFVGALSSAVALGGAAAAPSPDEAAAPASRSRDLYRQLHEGAAWLRGGLRDYAPEDDVERALKQAGQHVAEQRANLEACAARGQALAAALAGAADALGGLGAALGSLQRLESASFGTPFLLERRRAGRGEAGGVARGGEAPGAAASAAAASAATATAGADAAAAADAAASRAMCAAISLAAAGCLAARGPCQSAAAAVREGALPPLRALASDTSAATAAFAQRERARLSAATLRRDLEARRAALAAAQAIPASSGGAQRRQRLGDELERAEAALASADGAYARVAGQNSREVHEYRLGRARGLSRVLLRVAGGEAEAWAAMERAWRPATAR